MTRWGSQVRALYRPSPEDLAAKAFLRCRSEVFLFEGTRFQPEAIPLRGGDHLVAPPWTAANLRRGQRVEIPWTLPLYDQFVIIEADRQPDVAAVDGVFWCPTVGHEDERIALAGDGKDECALRVKSKIGIVTSAG